MEYITPLQLAGIIDIINAKINYQLSITPKEAGEPIIIPLESELRPISEKLYDEILTSVCKFWRANVGWYAYYRNEWKPRGMGGDYYRRIELYTTARPAMMYSWEYLESPNIKKDFTHRVLEHTVLFELKTEWVATWNEADNAAKQRTKDWQESDARNSYLDDDGRKNRAWVKFLTGFHLAVVVVVILMWIKGCQ
jgi:hypothetical protein